MQQRRDQNERRLEPLVWRFLRPSVNPTPLNLESFFTRFSQTFFSLFLSSNSTCNSNSWGVGSIFRRTISNPPPHNVTVCECECERGFDLDPDSWGFALALKTKTTFPSPIPTRSLNLQVTSISDSIQTQTNRFLCLHRLTLINRRMKNLMSRS